jgi:carbonic anhydrase/acetyltransferase-like protein (isoleucine patch superfamily)
VTVDVGTWRQTRVGARTLLMAHSHVGHDAIVGDDCDLAPGCVVGGSAEIGDRVKLGINSTVLPFRKVGDGATVGAGAVVTRTSRPARSSSATRRGAANPVAFTATWHHAEDWPPLQRARSRVSLLRRPSARRSQAGRAPGAVRVRARAPSANRFVESPQPEQEPLRVRADS